MKRRTRRLNAEVPNQHETTSRWCSCCYCEVIFFFFFFELNFIVLSVSYQTYTERRGTSMVRYSSMISSEECVGKRL